MKHNMSTLLGIGLLSLTMLVSGCNSNAGTSTGKTNSASQSSEISSQSADNDGSSASTSAEGQKSGDKSQKSDGKDKIEEAVAEVKERTDASDEMWLAAEVVLGVTMYYPDFEFEHIYVGDSDVIVEFKSEGKSIWIHSKPIDEEREKEHTRDVYSQNFGYATFDEADGACDTDGYKEVSMDDLSELIDESLLVTVYER